MNDSQILRQFVNACWNYTAENPDATDTDAATFLHEAVESGTLDIRHSDAQVAYTAAKRILTGDPDIGTLNYIKVYLTEKQIDMLVEMVDHSNENQIEPNVADTVRFQSLLRELRNP